ncbi:MAG: CHAT domain-containing protein [Bacteroidales bacterium]|nr:CHAT domain-containing protein [Bacteroidales bacterium]
MIYHNKQLKVLIYIVVTFIMLGNPFLISNCYSQHNENRIKIMYDSAWTVYQNGNYANSLEYLNKAIILKKQTNIDNPPEYVKIHNRRGIVYYELGNFQKAIESYVNALSHTQDEYYKSIINYNIANIYVEKGNYSKALDFYENSLSILINSENEKKYAKISDIYHNQGQVYHNLGIYKLALEKYLRCIQFSKEYNIGFMGDTYRNCGLVYEKMDSLELAKNYFVKAIEINIKTYNENHPKTILSYMSLATLLVKTKNYEKAEKLFNEIYSNLIVTVGHKHQYTSYYYSYIGDMYFNREDYKNALECYQQSLISKIPNFNDTALLNKPSSEIIPDMNLLEILKRKSIVLEKLSELENKETNLKAALSTLELTVGFIEQLRMGYLYEDSKLVLAEKEYESYMSIVKIAYELLNITGNKDYIHVAFKYSERSKYAILRESINEESARNIASISDSVQKHIQGIKEQIGFARLQIENENKLVNPDSLKQNELKEKLFRLTQSREKTISELEQKYPKYYKRKYENHVVGITELQSKISEKEAIISYELTDSALFTFLLTNETRTFTKIRVDTTFFKHLKQYQEFLHSEYEFGYVNYRIAAYELYKTLIKPIENHLKGKNLLIVPDSKMSLIAFESLITEPYQKQAYADYATEPYLLIKYPIGYAYSATLYSNSVQKRKKWNPKFLGIAPDYINSRDSLDAMPLVMKNIKAISRLIRGKAFTGEDATEYNLRKSCKNYGILHLYAHGNENLENPQFSKISLSYRNDTIEDGYLHAYEIDELDIEADLVVLASCFSGSGTINKSEGPLSIGRRFLNAGTPSLIISLWLAHYEPSLFELKAFYWHLVLGKRKDEALRLAKLKYIKSSNPLNASPRYWASLVIVGNQEALFRGFVFRKIVSLFIILAILAFLIKSVRLWFQER